MPAPHVDLRDLMQITDVGGYQRGLAYFREGNVLDVVWHEDLLELEGHVRGSSDAQYVTEIVFLSSNGTRRVRTTRCTCPVRSGCKHVVATLLASNVHEYSQQAAALQRQPDAEQKPAAPRTAAVASWRTLLDPAVSQHPQRLALGIELRHRESRSENHWGPRPVRAATARDLARPSGELLLAIRPMMRSAQTGAWIQGGAGWDAVRRDASQFGRDQNRWFGDLLSISRDSLLSGNAGEWLVLDQVESPLLWRHLRSATDVGIPLVPSQKSASVRIASAADVSAKISRTEEGALEVAAEVRIDDRVIPAREVHPIGRTGVYAASLVGARIEVVLAEVSLSEQTRALLAASDPILVPADDEQAFIADAYPLLARRSTVRTVGEVALPDVPEPEAVLTVSYERGDVVSYAFEWSYGPFGRVPFAWNDAAVRDAESETTRRAAIEAAWQEFRTTSFRPSGSFHDIDAAAFIAEGVPALEAVGVRVESHGERKAYRELTGDPEVKVTTVESTDSDWFDLGILVTIDGRLIPFGPLFTALSRGRKKLLLSDGGYFSLNHPSLDRLRDLIEEAGELDEWETGPRISRYQT
ncbi:SWIM zinc finger domain-containing protein, partial [uncultured Microbacterium sp.]|uniref:SWIM zinc finger family protein n=1 Tax=uncultured Microbacterium sp. TaxID=191216 RepID=UPI00345BA242